MPTTYLELGVPLGGALPGKKTPPYYVGKADLTCSAHHIDGMAGG